MGYDIIIGDIQTVMPEALMDSGWMIHDPFLFVVIVFVVQGTNTSHSSGIKMAILEKSDVRGDKDLPRDLAGIIKEQITLDLIFPTVCENKHTRACTHH